MASRLWGLIGLCLGLLFATTGAWGAEGLPDTVVDTLASLKASFRGIAGYPYSNGGPRGVVEDLAKHAAEVDGILGYARESRANREALATYLLADISNFTDRFRPGTVVDETLLAKSKWYTGETPWYGLTVDAYLLLELARDDGSPSFAKGALSSIAGAEQAIADFFRQRHLYLESQRPGQAGQGEEEVGPVGSTDGAELAWCCERFLVSSYPDERLASLPDASRVVVEYRDWRKSTLLKRGIEDWLPVDCEHDTMQYVRRLVAALP
jgi:hypothetical protein